MLQYTVFITGANRGLGFEFVRQYASDNWRVLASCRNLVQAKELQRLALHFENVTLLQLDVNNQIQLNQLAEKYADTKIDLLINNAGVFPEDELGDISSERMKQAFLTNAVAPLKIAETFLTNISRSHLKTILSLSYKMNAFKGNHFGNSYSYRASKAALNMIMRNLAVDLKNRSIKVFTVHPGKIKKDAAMTNVVDREQSVMNIRSLLTRLTERESGSFYDYVGNSLEW